MYSLVVCMSNVRRMVALNCGRNETETILGAHVGAVAA